MDGVTPLLWIAISGVLFGSQFVPQKLCPAFAAAAYNISMALGIALVSALGAPFAPGPMPSPLLALLALAGGFLWVAGNFLLIFAVQRAGMARPFSIINLTSVLSFIGGGALLGELGGLSSARVAAMAVGVGVVVLGSILVTLSSGGGARPGSGSASSGGEMGGLAAAFVAPAFFAAFNVIVAHIINQRGGPLGPTFVSFSPGIVIGAFLLALTNRLRAGRAPAPPPPHRPLDSASGAPPSRSSLLRALGAKPPPPRMVLSLRCLSGPGPL